MLVKFEYVFVRVSGSPPISRHCTNFISINSDSIISVKPASSQWSLIKEVNGSPVEPDSLTEVVYSTGNKTAKLTVLGNYSEVSKKLSTQGDILYG